MLIDVSYFISGPRHILNASKAETPKQDSVAVNAHIESYIKAYQKEFLEQVLGEESANIVIEEINSVEVDLSINAVCEHLKEPFADYVFFHILRDANEQATVTGIVRLKSANEYVSPIRAQVSTWNSMVDKIHQFVQWASKDECPLNICVSNHMLKPINTLNI